MKGSAIWESAITEKLGSKLKDVMGFFSRQDETSASRVGKVKQLYIVACYSLRLSEEITFSGPVWQPNITCANIPRKKVSMQLSFRKKYSSPTVS